MSLVDRVLIRVDAIRQSAAQRLLLKRGREVEAPVRTVRPSAPTKANIPRYTHASRVAVARAYVAVRKRAGEPVPDHIRQLADDDPEKDRPAR